MILDLNAPISRAGFGHLVGLSERRVTDLIHAGTISEGGTAQDWLWSYCAHLRAVAAGRSGGSLNLADERAALARVQRELAELKLAEERRELVRRLEVERHLASGLVALRDRLETVSSRTGAILAAESDTATCARVVRDEIRSALAAFTRETVQ